MSSKKTTIKSADEVIATVSAPPLRFPEFRAAGDWQARPLRDVATIIAERVGDRNHTPMSITAGVGLVSQVEKFGRVIAGSQYCNYLCLQHGDFAYNKSATNNYPQGFIARYLGSEPAAVPNSIFTCFRPHTDLIDGEYLNQLFVNNLHGRWLRRFTTVGARAHGSLNIDDQDILAIPVPMPQHDLEQAEQGRISACLSSLDELIGAEGQKLKAFKAHKKGLMQQLFPAEGEATPHLRVPGFTNSGEWTTEILGEIAENLDNRRVPVTAGNRVQGEVPYYGASGIVDFVDGYLFDEPLLCISEDGANLRDRSYPIAFSISGKAWINNHAHVLKFKEPATQKMIEEYLNWISLENYLTGMAQPKLNRAMLDSISIPLPKDQRERQQIADCLFSIDETIYRQRQRLDDLTDHKRGLMQQLFPSLDEVQA